MTPSAILQELESRGAVVRAQGDRLLIDAPADTLDAEVLAQVQAHKAELLQLVPRIVAKVYAHDLFVPEACRQAAITDPTLTEIQRANMAAYAGGD